MLTSRANNTCVNDVLQLIEACNLNFGASLLKLRLTFYIVITALYASISSEQKLLFNKLLLAERLLSKFVKFRQIFN